MVTRPGAWSTTKTTGTSAPPSSTSRSLAGLACTDVTVPTCAAVGEDDGRPDQLVHPERVVVVVVDRLGPQDRAAPGLGRVAVVDAVELHDPAVLVARADTTVRSPRSVVSTDPGSSREVRST